MADKTLLVSREKDALADYIARTKAADAGGVLMPAPEPALPPVPAVQAVPVVILGDDRKPIKGPTLGITSGATTTGRLDRRLDCRQWNAIHMEIIVSGTTPSVTIVVEGASEEGGNPIALPAAEATKTLGATCRYDVPIGAAWARFNITAISGTGATVIINATPYLAGAGTASKGVIVATGTGTAAVAVSSAAVAAGAAQRLVSVTCHLSSAPTTAGSLTVTLNAAAGSAYDTLLATTSMVGVTDYLYQPDRDLLLQAGDAIDVVYTNADTRTYGVQITVEAR